MIPKIIHYCWIGGAEMPELEQRCLASWKKYMPNWEYKRWDESNFDIAAAPLYVQQAYESHKYAFVSDYVRLWALEQYGGLYMDVDFEVFRPFDDLMDKYAAFAGYEGSKRKPVMQGVIASEPHGAWVKDMLSTYQCREFIKEDGSLDLTPNTSYFTDRLEAQGFVADGIEKDFYLLAENKNKENTADADKNIENSSKSKTRSPQSIEIASTSIDPQTACERAPRQSNDQSRTIVDSKNQLSATYKNADFQSSQKNDKNNESREFMLHVFPVHYFCPVLTTGEDVRTEETYCEHKGESSWAKKGWKSKLLVHVSPSFRTKLIKLKRRILG